MLSRLRERHPELLDVDMDKLAGMLAFVARQSQRKKCWLKIRLLSSLTQPRVFPSARGLRELREPGQDGRHLNDDATRPFQTGLRT
jgi:hypothetical protein